MKPLPYKVVYTLDNKYLKKEDPDDHYTMLKPGIMDKIIDTINTTYDIAPDQYTIHTEINDNIAKIVVTHKQKVNSQFYNRDTIKKLLPRLWRRYKDNIRVFSIRLKELIHEWGISWQDDGKWLQTELEKLTRDRWLISQKDFVRASINKKCKK